MTTTTEDAAGPCFAARQQTTDLRPDQEMWRNSSPSWTSKFNQLIIVINQQSLLSELFHPLSSLLLPTDRQSSAAASGDRFLQPRLLHRCPQVRRSFITMTSQLLLWLIYVVVLLFFFFFPCVLLLVRACLAATIRSSGASQSTIKLVATNLIANSKLLGEIKLISPEYLFVNLMYNNNYMYAIIPVL